MLNPASNLPPQAPSTTQQQGKVISGWEITGKKIANVAKKEKTLFKHYEQLEAGKLLTRVARGFLARNSYRKQKFVRERSARREVSRYCVDNVIERVAKVVELRERHAARVIQRLYRGTLLRRQPTKRFGLNLFGPSRTKSFDRSEAQRVDESSVSKKRNIFRRLSRSSSWASDA